jgi:hypothetical protein
MFDSELSYLINLRTLVIRNLLKGISNARNNRFSNLNFDVNWSHTHMATQQKLGLRAERKLRVGHIDFDRSHCLRQNLNLPTKEI